MPTLSIATRVASIDIFRGFVMFLMMAEVLEFQHIAETLPNNGVWSFLAFNQSHVAWVGCSLHDLIQPGFSFLVGVALPYSLASRKAAGGSTRHLWQHTLYRALILVLLGIFLRSMHAQQTHFTFEDTLTQIGLGYVFLFGLAFWGEKVHWIALCSILIFYWAIFALYPLPGPDFDWQQAGVAADWPHHARGFAAHWNKNTNAAWAFDRWFLNLFPREAPFLFNGGGYATLSFIPTLGTMILGLIAGNWMKKSTQALPFLKKLAVTGLVLLVGGWIIGLLGICPVVKRIWTPSWTLFSGGWCCLILAGFYYLVDVRNNKKWFYPLMVIGMNSIAAYVLAHTVVGFIDSSFRIHLGQGYDLILGEPFKTLVSGFVILLVQYFALHWMYKNKVFIKI